MHINNRVLRNVHIVAEGKNILLILSFNRESYPIHLKICKADKPFKPLPGFV